MRLDRDGGMWSSEAEAEGVMGLHERSRGRHCAMTAVRRGELSMTLKGEGLERRLVVG